jgi:hypothetical protein
MLPNSHCWPAFCRLSIPAPLPVALVPVKGVSHPPSSAAALPSSLSAHASFLTSLAAIPAAQLEVRRHTDHYRPILQKEHSIVYVDRNAAAGKKSGGHPYVIRPNLRHLHESDDPDHHAALNVVTNVPATVMREVDPSAPVHGATVSVTEANHLFVLRPARRPGALQQMEQKEQRTAQEDYEAAGYKPRKTATIAQPSAAQKLFGRALAGSVGGAGDKPKHLRLASSNLDTASIAALSLKAPGGVTTGGMSSVTSPGTPMTPSVSGAASMFARVASKALRMPSKSLLPRGASFNMGAAAQQQSLLPPPPPPVAGGAHRHGDAIPARSSSRVGAASQESDSEEAEGDAAEHEESIGAGKGERSRSAVAGQVRRISLSLAAPAVAAEGGDEIEHGDLLSVGGIGGAAGGGGREVVEEGGKVVVAAAAGASCCICQTTDFHDPWISHCGHICCSDCWVTWLNENSEKQCPECDTPISLEQLRPIALCPICNHIPTEPWTAPCKHTACLDCWKVWLQENPVCSECNEPVDKDLLPQGA